MHTSAGVVRSLWMADKVAVTATNCSSRSLGCTLTWAGLALFSIGCQSLIRACWADWDEGEKINMEDDNKSGSFIKNV